jgi:hypothetical protein
LDNSEEKGLETILLVNTARKAENDGEDACGTTTTVLYHHEKSFEMSLINVF